MVDFDEVIQYRREERVRRPEGERFLQEELERQLLAIGEGMLAFIAKHNLPGWQLVFDTMPSVTWRKETPKLFSRDAPRVWAEFEGGGQKSELFPIQYSAWLTRNGSWVTARTLSVRAPSRPFVLGELFRGVYQTGAIADCFRLFEDDGILRGAIPEDSTYPERNVWSLEMSPTGKVGTRVGRAFFTVEDQVASVLEKRLDSRH